MIQALDEKGFVSLQLSFCRRQAGVRDLTAAAVEVVARRLLAEVSTAQAAVLLALLYLTVGSGRVGRMMSMRDLQSGIREGGVEEFAGTGLARNTLRVAIDGLAARDLIHVYKEDRRGGYEGSAHIFEINFTKFDLDFGQKLRETAGHPGQFLTPSSYISISDFVTDEKSTEVASYFSPADSGGASVESKDMAYVGKKNTPAPGSSTRPAEGVTRVLAQVQQHHRAKAATRAAAATSAPPGSVTRESLQALLDSIYQSCGVGHRLIVTVKEFGLLRKRMVAAPPGDLDAMLRYSLTYWPVLAQQNRKAVSKDGEKLVAGKALPPAPHFSTFAYWYPYFLKAYQNHTAGRTVESQQSETDSQMRRLREELDRTREQITMMRRQRPRPALSPAPAPRPPLRPARPEVDTETEFPAWV